MVLLVRRLFRQAWAGGTSAAIRAATTEPMECPAIAGVFGRDDVCRRVGVEAWWKPALSVDGSMVAGGCASGVVELIAGVWCTGSGGRRPVHRRAGSGTPR